MKNVIITLPFLLLAMVTNAQNAIDADNLKRKLIQNDTHKYVEEGGVLNDALLKKPAKKKDLHGDGFIIHKPEFDADQTIHRLNGIPDQHSDQYHDAKSKSLKKLDKEKDPRVLESFEEEYKTPEQRYNQIKKQ